MIKRLRPAPTPEQIEAWYSTPHDHRVYGRGHADRVAAMITAVAGRLWGSAADLSCGNGAVLDAVNSPVKFYGDLAPGWPITGPVERTVNERLPWVDLYILGETLEHLDDPGEVLVRIEAKARYLLLSTPIEAWDDTNGQHLWAWDRAGVEYLIAEAAPMSVVEKYTAVDTRIYNEPYCYGIWLVKL